MITPERDLWRTLMGKGMLLGNIHNIILFYWGWQTLCIRKIDKLLSLWQWHEGKTPTTVKIYVWPTVSKGPGQSQLPFLFRAWDEAHPGDQREHSNRSNLETEMGSNNNIFFSVAYSQWPASSNKPYTLSFQYCPVYWHIGLIFS